MKRTKTAGSDGRFASAHYGGADNPYEAIKVIEAWGYDKDFCIGTLLRYICRAGKKAGNPPLQDLEKALWYLSRKIENMKKETAKPRRHTYEEKLERQLKVLSVIPRRSRLRVNR